MSVYEFVVMLAVIAVIGYFAVPFGINAGGMNRYFRITSLKNPPLKKKGFQ